MKNWFTDPETAVNRRAVLLQLGKIGVTFAALPLARAYRASKIPRKNTVQYVIDLILKEIPGAPFSSTVDTLKSGDKNQEVTGIITTMFTTGEVIEQAIAAKANFIIAHEPTFYNHQDDTNWTANNSIVAAKTALLKKHNIAVWRFHDYWHTYKPDGIYHGCLQKLNWLPYFKADNTPLQIPPMSLEALAQHCKKSLGIQYVRVIGDPKQSCSRISLLPGAWDGKQQVAMVEKEAPDVLIVGELREWETAEYIRDSRFFGKPTALIVLGHSVSEEPGMEWLVDWLQPKVPGISVKHIASKNPFTWV